MSSLHLSICLAKWYFLRDMERREQECTTKDDHECNAYSTVSVTPILGKWFEHITSKRLLAAINSGNVTEFPYCECDTKIETGYHFLMDCPLHDAKRARMHHTILRQWMHTNILGNLSLTMDVLLGILSNGVSTRSFSWPPQLCHPLQLYKMPIPDRYSRGATIL